MHFRVWVRRRHVVNALLATKCRAFRPSSTRPGAAPPRSLERRGFDDSARSRLCVARALLTVQVRDFNIKRAMMASSWWVRVDEGKPSEWSSRIGYSPAGSALVVRRSNSADTQTTQQEDIERESLYRWVWVAFTRWGSAADMKGHRWFRRGNAFDCAFYENFAFPAMTEAKNRRSCTMLHKGLSAPKCWWEEMLLDFFRLKARSWIRTTDRHAARTSGTAHELEGLRLSEPFWDLRCWRL